MQINDACAPCENSFIKTLVARIYPVRCGGARCHISLWKEIYSNIVCISSIIFTRPYWFYNLIYMCWQLLLIYSRWVWWVYMQFTLDSRHLHCMYHNMKIISIRFLLTFSLAIALFIIFVSIIFEPDQHIHGGMEYDVRVVNGFSSNSSMPLVIWCASKDSDLGGRALQEHDDFSWRLTTKFWTTTHFFCTMKWDQKRRSFDAFKDPRDAYRCGAFRKCTWLVKEDGFYFSNDELNWKKDFSW